MKRWLPFVLFLFSAQVLFAQRHLASRSVWINGERSLHGSGDLSGILFSVGYGKYIRKRWEVSGAATTTIHNGSYPLIVTDNGMEPMDASFRYTTAGLQAEGLVGFAPIRNRHHEFKLAAGPLVRYQSSSYPDEYGITYPIVTNYPEPVFTFRNLEKQNMITAGYKVALSYAYTFRNRLFTGLKINFQNDTNGDVITGYGLVLGKRF